MPTYQYECPVDGLFERRAGYNDSEVSCECGRPAARKPFYAANSFVAGRSLPNPSDHLAVQDEWFKEVRRQGWSGERSMEALRANRRYDKEGRMFIETGNLPKTS